MVLSRIAVHWITLDFYPFMLVLSIVEVLYVYFIVMAAASHVLIFGYSFVHRFNESFHCADLHSSLVNVSLGVHGVGGGLYLSLGTFMWRNSSPPMSSSLK